MRDGKAFAAFKAQAQHAVKGNVNNPNKRDGDGGVMWHHQAHKQKTQRQGQCVGYVIASGPHARPPDITQKAKIRQQKQLGNRGGYIILIRSKLSR